LTDFAYDSLASRVEPAVEAGARDEDAKLSAGRLLKPVFCDPMLCPVELSPRVELPTTDEVWYEG
jgi:hypothetical protein